MLKLEAIWREANVSSLVTVGIVFILATSARAGESADEDLRSARWWCQQMTHYAQSVEDPKALGDLAHAMVYVQLRSKDIDGALQSAAKVTDPQWGVYVYCAIAKRQHKNGNKASCEKSLTQARQIALGIYPNDPERFRIHYNPHLIGACVELGFPEIAKSYMNALPDGMGRHNAATQLLVEMAKAGQLEQALILKTPADKTSGPGYALDPRQSRNAVLTQMGNACASLGRVDDTLRCVELISDAKYRDTLYGNLIKALAAANRTDEAAELVDRIEDPKVRSLAKGQIRGKLAEQLDVSGIQSLVAQASEREEKLMLLRKLIDKQVAAGDLAGAETTIDSMVSAIENSPRPKQTSAFGVVDDEVEKKAARAELLKVAAALAERGDRQGYRQKMEEAQEAILSMPDQSGLGKTMPLLQLILTQIAADDFQSARKLAEKFSGNPITSNLPGQLAKAYAKANDLPSAMAMLKLMMPKMTGRAHQIGEVAAEFARGNHLAEAREVLATLDPQHRDAEAYQTFGRAMIESNQGQLLHDWLAEMPSDLDRAYACLGAAQGLGNKNARDAN